MRINVRKHYACRNGRTFLVRKHTRAKISRHKRKFFTALSNKEMEVGGYLDFDKGKGLHNVNMHLGQKYGVEFPMSDDYEVQWHTHPSEGASMLPTYEDIVSMRLTPQREQVIFTGDMAISIFESEKFNNIEDSKVKEVLKSMYSDLDKGLSDATIYAKYKPIFKDKLGLLMTLHKPNSDIKLVSQVV
jgi:hypothetical protein